MSNERLRAALIEADVSTTDLSAALGVDPKTVERWITTARTPHRAHRLKAAAVLRKDDAWLWPSTKDDSKSRSASEAELVQLYPNRGAVSTETWCHLITTASESIDLLAFAASFLHDSIPDFTQLLAERARAGVRVRLLFGDPDSEAVALRGEEEGIGDLLGSRCRLTWAYFAELVHEPGIEARKHGSTLYNSIFRFDNALLANTHTLGAPANHSPVLHFQRIPGGRLFNHYMSGFEQTWEAAQPL